MIEGGVRMIDYSTITLIVGILASVIGVATFVSGMVGRAKQDGALAANLQTCVTGISKIEVTLKDMNCKSDTYNSKVDRLEVRVENLERYHNGNNNTPNTQINM